MNANQTKNLERQTSRGLIKPGTLIRWHNGPIECIADIVVRNGNLLASPSWTDSTIPLETLIRNFGEDAIEIL